MSHFILLAVVPGENGSEARDNLDKLMEPYDENREAEAYREYEEDTPETWWFYEFLQEQKEHHESGTGVYPYNPHKLGLSFPQTDSRDPEHVQGQKIAENAALFDRLPEDVSWKDLLELYNEKYQPQNEDSYETEYFLDEEQNRIYTMSTYNPKSKWDWFQVGGRWRGYFIPKSTGEQTYVGEAGAFDNEATPGKVDALRVGNLDLEAMRSEAEDEAAKQYDLFESLREKHGDALPWSAIVAKVDGENFTIDEARREYRNQPLIQAVGEHSSELGVGFFGTIDRFDVSREGYIQRTRDEAVPGFALLDTEGAWREKGEMGWFGASSDTQDSRTEFLAFANAYLDAISETDPDLWVFAVDCHI